MNSEASTTPGERLMDYTHSRLVAVFDHAPDVQATTDALSAAGFGQSFDVHCGVAGARLIDFSGEDHGALGRFSHALHHLTVESEHMHHYESELLAGHCVVMVLTHGTERRECAQDIFAAHNARFVNQFGLLMVQTLAP